MVELLHEVAPDASLRAAAHVAVAHVEHIRQAAFTLELLGKEEQAAGTKALVKSGIAFSEECGTKTRAQIVAAILKKIGRFPLPPPSDPDNPVYREAKFSAADLMLYDAIMISGAAALTGSALQQVAGHSLARFSGQFA